MLKEETKQKCPFCNIGDIEVIIFPSTKKYQKGPWGGSKASIVRTQERIIIISDKCPNCGKTKKEIEKALKEGKQPTNEEIIKRMREAGLDPTKLK